MTKIEAALHVLFADNLADLESEYNVDTVAEVLGASLNHTNHWYELRHAAKAALLTALTSKE